jgi:hypothetical protein
MQFVKLWSCIECFFAITDEKITEANAKGIAAILVFGGYQVIAVDKYADTKRRVKQLYKLRSTALGCIGQQVILRMIIRCMPHVLVRELSAAEIQDNCPPDPGHE